MGALGWALLLFSFHGLGLAFLQPNTGSTAGLGQLRISTFTSGEDENRINWQAGLVHRR